MSEYSWIGTAKPLKPVSRSFGFVTQPLELPARPADDIDVDPLEGRAQLRPIEVAVVVDLGSGVCITSTYAPLRLTLLIDAPRNRLQPTALRFFVWFRTK